MVSCARVRTVGSNTDAISKGVSSANIDRNDAPGFIQLSSQLSLYLKMCVLQQAQNNDEERCVKGTYTYTRKSDYSMPALNRESLAAK